MYAIRSYYGNCSGGGRRTGARRDPPPPRRRRIRLRIRPFCIETVITSYSIHYTKLYDEYTDAFLGEKILEADLKKGRFLDVRVLGEVAVATLTRPEALNALNEELLSQLSSTVRELGSLGTIEGRNVRALVLTGAA